MPQSVCKAHMNYKKDIHKKGHFKNNCKCCNDYAKHQDRIIYARGGTIQGLKLLNNSLVDEIQDYQDEIQELRERLAEMNYDDETNERVVERVVIQQKPSNLVFTDDLPITWKLKNLAIKCAGETPNEDMNETACECVVCKDKKTKQIILSCGHLTCQSCMLKIDNKNECPICRQPPQYAKVVYFV